MFEGVQDSPGYPYPMIIVKMSSWRVTFPPATFASISLTGTGTGSNYANRICTSQSGESASFAKSRQTVSECYLGKALLFIVRGFLNAEAVSVHSKHCI